MYYPSFSLYVTVILCIYSEGWRKSIAERHFLRMALWSCPEFETQLSVLENFDFRHRRWEDKRGIMHEICPCPQDTFQSCEYICNKYTILQSTIFFAQCIIWIWNMFPLEVIKIILVLDLGKWQISTISNIIQNKIRKIKPHTSWHKLRPHERSPSGKL